MEPVCDIVLLVWNHREETEACLEALRRNTRLPCRVLIVDNGSEAPTREWLTTVTSTEWLTVTLLRNEQNKGSPGGFNRGLLASQAPYVVLMSNDVMPQEGWLEELLAVARSEPRIGIINPSSNTSGQVIPEGMTAETFAAQVRQTQRGWMEMSFGEFYTMLITRQVIARIGAIDESYGMAYFDDTDYCRRAQEAGFLCVRARASFVYHQEGRSLKDTWQRQRQRKAQFDQAAALFAQRWGAPKRIAYVVKDPARLETQELTEALRRQLHAFHRIWMFYEANGTQPHMPEHADLLPFPLSRLSFIPRVLWKVLMKKKRFHEVVTDRRWLATLLRLLAPIHRAQVRFVTL